MHENYRNARQITEYCNDRFHLTMNAINLDGSGVHVMKNQDEFEKGLLDVFHKPKSIGLSCILVKNIKEATYVLEKIGINRNKTHDMTKDSFEIQRNKWNVMTVEQAKGLEFETVFAISGSMTENEKYIAYTSISSFN